MLGGFKVSNPFLVRLPVLVLIFLLYTTNLLSQCTKAFQVSVGGTADDVAYDVADAGNGQFFVAGTTASFGAGGLDVLITKMSAGGIIVWSKVYGGSGTETVRKISATPDSGLLVIGLTTSFNSNGDIFCMKVDAKGNLVWSRRFGISTDVNGDLGLNIIQTTDGGYAFTGVFSVEGQIGRLVFAKLDASANIVWFKRLYGSQGSDGTGIIQDGDNLIVTSDLDNNGVNYTSLIMRCNMLDGSIINQTEIVPSSRGLFGPFLFKDINADGYWLSCHTIDQYSYAAMQPTILHLDNNFKILNTYSYKVPGLYTNDYFTGFSQMSNGFVACASSTSSPTSGYLFNIQNDGTVKWGKNFVGKNNRSLYRLGHIGNQIISVGRDDNNGKGDDFFVSGFSEDGFIDSLCHPDTSAVAITNPVFSEKSFTWTTIDNPTFADISAPISVSTVSLTPQSLCDACPVPVVTPAFSIPDTVCVNAPVTIKNTTVGASSYYWSFCTADINQPPTGTNLGNVSGVLNTPVFIDYATQNGNYYAFTTNFQTGELVRLDFGTSMLNNPTATDLGSFGGILPYATTEGIQVVQNNGNWYALIVGGTPANGTAPKIVKIAFGTSLTNPNPVATDWGNIGNLDLPHDLYVFQQGINWYGFTINKNNNTVTRFDFGSSFENVPSATNLGTFAGFNMPTGIFASNDNGQWHVFVVNSYDGVNPDVTAGTVTRLDFGTSLLNTAPTAVNLGNIGGLFHNPRDIYIIKYCGANVGFVVNHATNDIVRLDFPGDLSTTPTATSLGNIGNLSFPHSISKLFRVGADIYALIPNASSSTITRIKFSGCTSSSTSSSTVKNPPAVTYSTPGIYNINLTIDDELATQNSLCQQVVVLGPPTIHVNNDTSICSGDSVHLLASGAASYQWSPTATLSNPNIPNPVAKPLDSTRYYVTGKNSSGCAAKDSVTIKILQHPTIKTIPDTSVCSGSTIKLTTTAVNGSAYSWLPSTGLSDPTVLSPSASPVNTTTYVIDVTGKNGCTNKDSVKVTVLHQATVKSISDTSICNGTTIQLTTTVVNGNKYSWSPAKGLSDSTVLSPSASPTKSTQYIVTVNPGSQCSAKDTVNITVNPLPSLTVSPDTAICSGSTVQLTAQSPNSVVYSWSPKAGLSDTSIYNPIASPAATIQYFVTATTNKNCFAKDSVTITVLHQAAVKSISDTSICSGTTIQLTTTAVNGNKYSWSPATGLSDTTVISPAASPTKSTQYIVTVNPGSQCSAKDTVNITVNPVPSLTVSPDTAICSGSTVQLTALSAGSPAYSWSPAGSLTNPSITNPVASPTATTTYYIKVTDKNNCKAQDSITITVTPVPAIVTLSDTTIILCRNSTIQLTTTASNATKYSWSPATGLSDPTALSPYATPLTDTKYIITAKNGQCFATDSVNITVKSSPSVTASGDTTLCAGGTVKLSTNASPGVAYSWLPTTGLSDPSSPNPSATPLSSTEYVVQVKFSNGCTAKDSVAIVVDAQPTVSTLPDTTICSGVTIQLATTVVNGNTYSWSPATGLSNPSILSPLANPSANTQYIITVNPGTLCIAKDTVNITVNPTPTVKVSADTAICAGSSSQLIASSPANVVYSWSPTTGLSDSAVYNPVASPAATTTYFVTAIANNQCSAKDSVTVKVLPQPAVKSIPDTTICSGTTIQLATTAVNGNTYSWSPAAGLSNPSTLSPLANPSANTQYIITVNPGTLCIAKDTVNITVNPTPTVKVSADTAICNGSSSQLIASSPANVVYSWSPTTGLNDSAVYNPVASPTATTTYFVTAIANNQCSAKDSVTVKVLPQPTVKSIPDTTICSGVTIQLATTAFNGNTYSWSPAVGLSNPSVLSPLANPSANTQYIITINPGNQCTAKDTVNVTVSPSPIITMSADTTICSGTSIHLTASAPGNVVYNWLPNNSLSDSSVYNPVVSPAATTKYFVTVVLNNQCAAKDSVTVTVLLQPSVKTIPDTSICSGTTIQLATTAVNGNTYSWSPAIGLSNPSTLSPLAKPSANTQYIITVNPGNQCTAKATVNVTVNALPLLKTSNDTLICAGGAGQLLASSPNNVTYSWLPVTGLSNPHSANPIATPAATTMYNVTVTDGNFCAANATVTITVNPQPVFGITPASAAICIGDTVTVTASGGDTYSWSPTSGVTSPTAPATVLSPQATTTYQVFITNSVCKVTDTVQALITVATKPVVTITKSNDVDCFVGQATLQATGGTQYTWSPAASLNNPYSSSPVASPFETTTYYVEVSKGASCVAEDSIQVKVLTNAQNAYNVPNAFTPNGDGANDCFGVKLWGGIKSIDFSVYSRWGERIFHTNNPNDCWDGTYKGQKEPPGAFVYQIQANTICGMVYRKGTVVLVR